MRWTENPKNVVQLHEIPQIGSVTLIGKGLVLKTSSNRVKAMCRFESYRFRSCLYSSIGRASHL